MQPMEQRPWFLNMKIRRQLVILSRYRKSIYAGICLVLWLTTRGSSLQIIGDLVAAVCLAEQFWFSVKRERKNGEH
jgi:hypothetical protein